MFSIKIDKKITKSHGLKEIDSFNYYQSGEIFEPSNYSVENLYDGLVADNELPKLVGEFTYLVEDKNSVYIINDEVGTIEWYYYSSNDIFMVSNNFWEIVSVIEPSLNDINKEIIYEQMLMVKTFDGSTFIKNINIIQPGNLLKFSKQDFSLSIRKYADIEYIEDATLTKEKVFDEIEVLFQKTIDQITLNNRDSKIGVTISGGLDSRFPLPFLNKKNVAVSYLIGQDNSMFFKAFDYDNAKKMANLYNLQFKMIDPFDLKIKEKILIDILRNPTQDSDILKSINYKKVFSDKPFDLLITGAYGGLIGGRVLNENLLDNNDVDNLAYQLFYDYSLYREINQSRAQRTWIEKKYRKGLWYLNKIFKTTYFLETPSRIEYVQKFIADDFLFNKEYKMSAINKLKDYINGELCKNKNSLSIVMKYHISRHCIVGSFESLQGQVKSYSIYHPYIYEFSKSWPREFLQNRSIMEEYLLRKHERLASIPLQSKSLPINYRHKKMSRIKSYFISLKILFLFRLKGLSISYTKWFFNDEIQEEIKSTFNNSNSFFYKIFKKEDVKHILKYKNYTHFTENLFKMKILIDLIETKEYKKLLDQDIYRKTTKY